MVLFPFLCCDSAAVPEMLFPGVYLLTAFCHFNFRAMFSAFSVIHSIHLIFKNNKFKKYISGWHQKPHKKRSYVTIGYI